MTKRSFYLILTILGAILPWIFFSRYMIAQGGFPLGDFIAQITSNDPSRGVAADIMWAALVFWIWSFFDARNLNLVKRWLLVIPATMMIGLSCALPLYLYLREPRATKQFTGEQRR